MQILRLLKVSNARIDAHLQHEIIQNRILLLQQRFFRIHTSIGLSSQMHRHASGVHIAIQVQRVYPYIDRVYPRNLMDQPNVEY
jgi:hypothetical protein